MEQIRKFPSSPLGLIAIAIGFILSCFLVVLCIKLFTTSMAPILLPGVSDAKDFHAISRNGNVVLTALIVALVLILAGILIFTKRTVKDIINFKKFPPLLLLFLPVFAIGELILLTEIGHLLTDLFSDEPGIEMLGGMFEWIVAVLIGPFLEEILFRGVLLGGLLTRYRARTAILISALLFALPHMDPIPMISAFTFGIFTGWIFHRTGSLLPCFFYHGFFNGIAMSLDAYESTLPQLPGSCPDQFMLWPLWIDILGIFLIIAGILGMIKVLRGRQIS